MHIASTSLPFLQNLLFLFFCLFPFLVSSQPIRSTIEHEQVDILIEKWTTENGVPYQSGISLKKSAYDSRGFMWIYPNNSLVRFDGEYFKEYHFKPNHRGIFKGIGEDLSGNLWLVNCEEECSLFVFNPKQECFYTVEEYLKSSSYPSREFLNSPDLRVLSIERVIFIISDIANEVWKYDGQFRQVFKEKPVKHQAYLPGPGDLFWKMARHRRRRDTVFLVDATGEPVQAFPISKNFRHYFIDTNYQLWHVNYLHDDPNPSFLLQDIHPVGRKNTSALPADIYSKNEFPPYYTSADSSYTLLRNREKLTLLQQDQVIIDDIWPLLEEIGVYSSSTPYSLQVSDDGSFWMAYNGYLLRLDFREKNFATLLKGHSVRHISALGKGSKLLINSYDSPPLLVDIGQQKQQPIFVNNHHHLYSGYSQNDYLWIGGAGGELYQYAYTTEKTIIHKLDFWDTSPSEARAFHFLSDSTFLFCSNYGVHRYNHKSRKFQYLIEGSPGYWIHEDQKGELWAATGKGLCHLPSQQYYLDSLDNKPLNVQHIYETPDGDFWLSTNQGLLHWKPFGELIQKISTADGLSNSNVHAVYPDQRGVLWLSTDYGVSAVDTKSNRIQNFSESDGLINNEFNYLAHCSTADGRLFFGGVNGISAFYPDSIPLYEDSLHHDIYIGTATLFDAGQQVLKSIIPDSSGRYSLTIPPSSSQVLLDVALPHFDGHQVVFQWRIPGIFNTWTAVKEDQIIVNGLTPGKHQLALRAYLFNAPTHVLTKQISIFKRGFFYQQTWFWVTFLAGILFVSWFFYRWRSSRLILRTEALEELIKERTSELQQQKEIVEKQKNRLEEVDQAKTRLFNNVNHEFRTPLSLISGYSEQLLALPNQSYSEQQPLLQIKKQTDLLAEMVDEILNLQKIDSGILSLQKSVENWTGLVKQQFNLFNGLAQKKQFLYLLEVVPEKPCIVTIDQKKVTRIMQNLIGNAIKYTPARGQILVRTEIIGSDFLFTVKDNGLGIPIEEQASIFNRFYQGQATKGNSQPGYGIGLALSAEYAQLMGADLWVESQPNKGTTFFFRLAKEEVDEQEQVNAIPAPLFSAIQAAPAIQLPALQNINHQTAHLLVVEDNEELRTFLVNQLSERYQVTGLQNGQLALDFLREHKQIDLIISDFMMPVMDGKELLTKIRADKELGFIPFLMLTALAELPDKIDAYRLGVDGYLTKPFELEELWARVLNLVHYGQARKGRLREQPYSTEKDTNLEEGVSYDHPWVKKLEAIVKKEMVRPELKIGDIASQLRISERTLRSRILTHTGMKPSVYITKARLNKALQLIHQHQYVTVAEVSDACGFKNTAYFSKLFKKEFGKSPSFYF